MSLPALSPALVQQRDQFAAWMTDFVKKPRLSRQIKPGDLALFNTHLTALDDAVRQQSESSARIAALRQKFAQNMARLNAGNQAKTLKDQAAASAAKLEQTLLSLQQNTQLYSQLLEQAKVIKALTQATYVAAPAPEPRPKR